MVIYNHYITTTVNHNIASHHCIVPYTDKHFSFSPLLHFQVFQRDANIPAGMYLKKHLTVSDTM